MDRGELGILPQVAIKLPQVVSIAMQKSWLKDCKLWVLPDMKMVLKKPTKFFVNSMSDLFHEKMPFEYLDRVFNVIKDTPQHQYQILTKREKTLAAYFKHRAVPDNVWLGVTVEHKKPKIE